MIKYFLCDEFGRYLSIDGFNEMLVKVYMAAYCWNTADETEAVARMAKTSGLRVVAHYL